MQSLKKSPKALGKSLGLLFILDIFKNVQEALSPKTFSEGFLRIRVHCIMLWPIIYKKRVAA